MNKKTLRLKLLVPVLFLISGCSVVQTLIEQEEGNDSIEESVEELREENFDNEEDKIVDVDEGENTVDEKLKEEENLVYHVSQYDHGDYLMDFEEGAVLLRGGQADLIDRTLRQVHYPEVDHENYRKYYEEGNVQTYTISKDMYSNQLHIEKIENSHSEFTQQSLPEYYRESFQGADGYEEDMRRDFTEYYSEEYENPEDVVLLTINWDTHSTVARTLRAESLIIEEGLYQFINDEEVVLEFRQHDEYLLEDELGNLFYVR